MSAKNMAGREFELEADLLRTDWMMRVEKGLITLENQFIELLVYQSKMEHLKHLYKEANKNETI